MPTKSSSRAHVPDLISTIKKPEYQRSASLGHRRSQSETINSKTAKVERLSNVRPRYLEPKTNHNKLPSNLAVKAISHSSSDSSRNASPSSNRHHPPMKRQQNKENDSTNMSRDSLASPAKTNKLTKNKSSHDIDRSIDSLGESMLSSIKTEKTLSQESIIVKRKDNLNKPSLKSISRSNPMINKQSSATTATTAKTRPLSNKLIGKPRPLSGQTTNENSPSSVTTKSSRLSSLSSPRDVHKTLSQQTVPVKKSFLSAKSKEILAKKQSLNHTDSTRSVPAAVRSEKIPVNKSLSTSNVPHSKPNPFNTTLHLRRTAKVSDDKSVRKGGSNKSIPSMNGKSNAKMTNGRTGKVEKKLEKLCVEIEGDVETEEEENTKPLRIDSKLERSSTFCKESSDVPLSELHIIE